MSDKNIAVESRADYPVRARFFSAIRPPSYWDVVGQHLPVALISGGVLLAARVIPFQLLPIRTCAFLNLTGYPCPFCGFTRSFQAMAHGDPVWAWHNAPLAVLLYAATAVLFAWHSAGLMTGTVIRRGHSLTLPPGKGRYVLVVLLGLVLVNWIYRLVNGLK